MKNITSAQLREMFQSFMESKGHHRIQSASIIPENDPIVSEVLGAYEFPATLLGAVRYGQGHINDTFCLVCQPQEGKTIRFILQGLSLAAFPRQEELMENFIGITSHLRRKIEAAGGKVEVM